MVRRVAPGSNAAPTRSSKPFFVRIIGASATTPEIVSIGERCSGHFDLARSTLTDHRVPILLLGVPVVVRCSTTPPAP
jgi:hypothetical protein